MSYKPLEISKKKKGVHGFVFSKDSFITPSRGRQRVAEGDMIKWYTLRIPMHLFSDRSGDYI